MAKQQIKKLVEDSKNSVAQEFDDSVRSIKDEINGLKESTIAKI